MTAEHRAQDSRAQESRAREHRAGVLRADGTPRVVVTGFGVKSPAGGTPAEVLATVLVGKSQAVHVPELLEAGTAVSFGCPAQPLDEERYFSKPERRRLDRMTKLGVAAADDAVAAARPGYGGDPARHGVYVGTAAAAWPPPSRSAATSTPGPWTGCRSPPSRRSCRTRPPRTCPSGTAARAPASPSPPAAPAAPPRSARPSSPSGLTAGSTRPSSAASTRSSPLRDGRVRPHRHPRPPRPHPAHRRAPVRRRPRRVRGGEAAAFLTLERADHAAARGARVYGEVAGYGCASDAAHLVQPRPDGEVAARS